MEVDDAEEGFAFLLRGRVLAEASGVVAEVLLARWLDPAENPHRSRGQYRNYIFETDDDERITGAADRDGRRRDRGSDRAGARAVADAGATMLRGGAFKPRTSPYTFQGLGDEALAILREAREETGLPVVTELMDPRHVEAVLDAADVIQIGARNSQNFLLLAEVGRADKPVLLKRGLSSSVEELLMAAEYVAKEGNERI